MIDANGCCGYVARDGERVIYLHTNRHWKPETAGQFDLIDVEEHINRQFVTCGDNSQGIITVCPNCAIKLGLLW